MALDEAVRKSRVVAHRVGVAGGVIVGVAYLTLAIQAFFVGGFRDWVGLVLWALVILAQLSFLPLSVLAVFKPRVAAYAIMSSLVVVLVGGEVAAIHSGFHSYWSVRGVVEEILVFYAPPGGVAALLLYGSRKPKPAGPQSTTSSVRANGAPRIWIRRIVGTLTGWNRREQTRWFAIVLGLFAGAWRFPLGVHQTYEGLRLGYWVESLGVAGLSLTLLPLSVLAIFKPRPAAYGASVSLAAALLCPLVLLRSPNSSPGGVASTLALNLLLDLPLVLVTGLLLYGCSLDRGQADAQR